MITTFFSCYRGITSSGLGLNESEKPGHVSIKCTNEKNETDISKTAFLPHFKRLWITC
jgi:hypothetical protein